MTVKKVIVNTILIEWFVYKLYTTGVSNIATVNVNSLTPTNTSTRLEMT